MRIAITGAGGLLGQNILQILKETDNTVYAFSSQGNLLQSTFGDTKNFCFLEITDDIPAGIDVLIHCAFPRNEDGEQLVRRPEIHSGYFLPVCRKRLER